MTDLVPNEIEFILYTNDNGDVKLNVLVADEAVWLTQEGMQKLFGRTKSTVSEHISNVFSEGELNESSVVRNFRTTAADGKNYHTSFYNLDVVISVANTML